MTFLGSGRHIVYTVNVAVSRVYPEFPSFARYLRVPFLLPFLLRSVALRAFIFGYFEIEIRKVVQRALQLDDVRIDRFKLPYTISSCSAPIPFSAALLYSWMWGCSVDANFLPRGVRLMNTSRLSFV